MSAKYDGCFSSGATPMVEADRDKPTVLALRELAQGLKQQLRGVLHAHCGVELLRTRKMMMELQKL